MVKQIAKVRNLRHWTDVRRKLDDPLRCREDIVIDVDQLLTSTHKFNLENASLAEGVVDKAKAQTKAHVELLVVREELFDEIQFSFHDNPFSNLTKR